MSPEQARGQAGRQAHRHLGVRLRALRNATGRTRLHGRTTVSDTLAAMLTRDVDWTKLPSTTPPRIVALIQRLSGARFEQRLRDAGERDACSTTHCGRLGSALLGRRRQRSRWLPGHAVRRRACRGDRRLATAVAVGAAWRLVTVNPLPVRSRGRARYSKRGRAGWTVSRWLTEIDVQPGRVDRKGIISNCVGSRSIRG